MRLAFGLRVGLCSVCCLPAFGQTYSTPPIDAQVVTENGSVWTLDTEDVALNTSRFSSGLERRAVLEFPIEIIPAGVLVRSATIEFEVAGLTHSAGEFPIIEFHGYAGDGTLSVDDAQQPSNLIGVSDPITTLGEKPIIALDPTYIESLFGKATRFGLYTFQRVLGRQVDFYSMEGAELFPVSPPMLTLELAVPVAHGDVIYMYERRDLVWDPHRNMLYITTASGELERFDAASRVLLEPWPIGDSLLGADITPDGRYLFVAEDMNSNEHPRVLKVNLDTGGVTTIGIQPAFGEVSRGWDIKIVSDSLGFVTTGNQGSGWVPFREFDVTLGLFKIREDAAGSGGLMVTGRTILRRSADRSTMYVLEGNISSGPVIVYDTASDAFVADANTGHGWNELAAASPSGDALAQMIYNAVDILDRSLDVITELDEVRGGMVFDPTKPMLYVADENRDRIVAFDTRSYEARFDMPIGESILVSRGFDEGVMEVSHDGSLLFLTTRFGVRLYELTGLSHDGIDAFVDCLSGPGSTSSPTQPGLETADCLRRFDCDADGDVDLADSGSLLPRFAGN